MNTFNTRSETKKHNNNALLKTLCTVMLAGALHGCDNDDGIVIPEKTPAKISTATVEKKPQGGILQDTDYIVTSISTSDKDGFESAKIYLINGDQNLGEVDTIAQGEKTVNIKISATMLKKGEKSSDYIIRIEGNGNTKDIVIPMAERMVPGDNDAPIQAEITGR